MKALLPILFMLPCYAFGQQFLWSTMEPVELAETNVNLITIDDVNEKVMDYYDFYDYYYDLTGFSRDGFKAFLEKNTETANSIQWDPAMTFNKPTAFAFKANDGRGSLVIVMLIQKENIDLILFSSNLEQGAKSATSAERHKFTKWFSSFWDYGIADSGNQGSDQTDQLASNYEVGSGDGDVGLSVLNRGWAVPPDIEDNGQQAGVVMVEVRVARDGRITFARVSLRGTTLTDKALWDRCERAVRAARFNEIEGAPREQRGLIPFRFKLK
ncbi:hypothetical protein [Parapedobacter indicus]|uniref:TonB family C-terminal domain-containing protein n=1 Tax=Parapedobacter indicus TaxID=1477437 RepID=A0A1I3GJE8_9SPHI|nr:hypothetical protein [Parapedobacter indicus]PPL02677.1 hypothetical protein CLV26_1033 [Parapedobacter indicus]SFI23606.1 hypothetical protein SAMN05444682_1032 [Parapedobacter indicus]